MKCTSLLVVSGRGREAMDAFIDDEFHFERITPIPLEANLYGLSQWRQKYWGCPDLGAVILYADKKDWERHCKFITLGTPPLPIIKTLLVRFPHLNFSLMYRSDEFRGILRGKNGVITEEQFHELGDE